jgi:glycosyltransferase involved in cell wall biosynthesis
MKTPQTGGRPRAVVLAPSFSTEMNANRSFSAACVLSRLADVEVVTTDFDHWTKRTKEKLQCPPIAGIVYLKTLSYGDNTSVVRLLSHLLFSLHAGLYFLRNRNRFEIVYAALPFNTLAWIAMRLAGDRVKIVDVTDIWPDVLPFPQRMRRLLSPAFQLWRRFFNQAAGAADVMMAVSDSFYRETAKYVKAGCRSKRFYLGEVQLLTLVPKNEALTIAYVGNLGRLYDFETLLDVMAEAGPGRIQFHIVGDGDRRDWLLSELTRRKVAHQYFGSVYDPAKLGDILCRAHLGFNGFVNTSAAFSTKATTYMSAGLPILNSMRGDLEKLVAERGLGFNYVGGDRESLCRCLAQVNEESLALMAENCKDFFAAELDRTRVREAMYIFLRECLEEQGLVPH